MNKIKKHIARFLHYAQKVDNISNIKLFILYILSYVRYKCTIKDFFTCKFYFLNNRGKKLFATGEYLLKMYKKINNPEDAKIMRLKEETFLKFGKWMKREWCGVNYNNSLEDYEKFIKNNSKCIVKPLDLCAGIGIRIIDLEGYSAEQLRQECLKNNEMVEELIVQHEKMRMLHPASVNTIRITTEKGRIIGVTIRIGTGGNSVDNACAGGVFAQVNIEEGMIVSSANSYDGKKFYRHPDTGLVLLGFEIPYWNECINLVNEAVKVLPDIPITGFDIAITADGPVLVEVNESPDIAIIQQTQTIQLDKRLLENY